MVADDRADAPALVLDDGSQRGFIDWFRRQPQDQKLIRFFDRKGFYSVHGDNALFVAKEFYKTNAVLKKLGNPETGLPSVTLNRSLFENVLRELLLERAEYSVELYEGTGSSWRMTRTASPGKLSQFEEELFKHADMAEVPVVMAVVVSQVEQQRVVGVAYVDAATRHMGACEFNDDDQFCSLEAVVVQLGAKECVLMKETADTADAKRVRDVLMRCSAMAADRPRSQFAARNLQQDIARLVKSGSAEHHQDVLERPHACQALAAVLAFSEVLADSSSHGQYNLELYDPKRYMRLDAAAQRALNVMPSRLDATSTFSLYGLLNLGRTAMAKRRLKVWLKQPLVDLEAIRHRHDVVEALLRDSELRSELRDQHLRGLPDVERLARKLEQRRATLADLCQLYRASAKLPLIEEALRRHEGPHADLLVERFADKLRDAHDAEHLTKFEELLEAAIDLDRIPDEYLISATYNPRLETLKEEKEGVEAAIDRLANEAAKDLGLVMDKTIKLEWHKVNLQRTRCLRITQKEEKQVRGKLQSKYLVLETRKDGTKFTSRKMKEAAEQLQAASSQYETLQKELVEQVVEVARTFTEVWEAVAQLLAELDVLGGFAEQAANAAAPYVRPEMLGPEAGEVSLEGSRHPCVEAQDGVSFIKNDCKLVRGQSWFQIITGPNMGGKSTFIRQVGACVLMAQVGSFVPCDSARIAVRDCIFARVGAGDCQQRGLSTFMAEMLETAAILKGATERSLVIIDELGRGTSTYDGFGLAWAISEHLLEVVGCATLFATHFHELTELQGPGGVANKHVGTYLDPATGRLTMLYSIKDGACDQSFGIHVAESANFPSSVVEMAKEKLAELESTAPKQQGQQTLTGGKRRRVASSDEEAAAQKVARKFLQEFSALPLDRCGSDEEAKSLCGELMQRFEREAAEVPLLQQLLAP